jgi:hypothetical protein
MDTGKPDYSGPERRKRRVYITQNHEYHCKDGVCMAVRDTRTGQFVLMHDALGKRLTGAFVLRGRRGIGSVFPPENVAPGHRVYFSIDAQDEAQDQDPSAVMTSSLKSIERPPREVVAQYDRTFSGLRSLP